MKYLALLRGINVGGKNKIPMAKLKECFEKLGFENVATYIQSGNVLFESKLTQDKVARRIEKTLPNKFKLDSESIKVFVITHQQLKMIAKKAPRGFGQEPNKYHSDVAFLKGVASKEALKAFDPRPEVDAVWTGPGAIYFRRLSSKLSKSHLSKIASTKVYQDMTIRSWNTVSRLLERMEE